jgi:hypothetical protein
MGSVDLRKYWRNKWLRHQLLDEWHLFPTNHPEVTDMEKLMLAHIDLFAMVVPAHDDWTELRSELAQAVYWYKKLLGPDKYSDECRSYFQRLQEYRFEKLLRKFGEHACAELVEDLRDALQVAPRPEMVLGGSCRDKRS